MVEALSPIEAERRAEAGELLLVDLRSAGEILATGRVAGAQEVGPDALGPLLETAERPVALLCQRGQRSLRACEQWQPRIRMPLYNVAGGVEAWIASGLPLAIPESVFTERARERYRRHFVLPQVGEAGQQRLKQARVLLVGAGGLGSPAALYLAAAGVGRIAIVDDDRVERSNLQRQVLHSETALGSLKVESARQRLVELNPDIEVEVGAERLGPDAIDRWLDSVDLVVDGCDNFPTRYLLNAACIRHRVPLVYGAVERFSGQVGVFAPWQSGQPCYRCLFPEPPLPGDAPDCAEAGVLGVLPGIVGSLQAAEALKWLLGLGDPLLGRVMLIDALEMRFHTLRVEPDPACVDCRAAAGA